ncbi:MAG: hypothetical protein KO206_06455 [Methanomicrobiaceae archaeon]|nr:hypothetical protein [Methanomicrobiaceae archaeon]MDD5418882.1 hypothetical protein [Methanomicrobiaceae archaeon]
MEIPVDICELQDDVIAVADLPWGCKRRYHSIRPPNQKNVRIAARRGEAAEEAQEEYTVSAF